MPSLIEQQHFHLLCFPNPLSLKPPQVNTFFTSMANQSKAKPNVDPNSGFCHSTRTFHSLRPHFPLPPPSQSLSITDFAFSLLPLNLSPSLNRNDEEHRVSLFPLPLFHVFGFVMLLSSVAMGDTIVLMQRFDFEGMLKAVQRYKITYMPVSPPLVVALTKSELVNKYNLSSLRLLGCGGAPLGKNVAQNFKVKFPNLEIAQGYGLTESTGLATRTMGLEETKNHGSVGKLHNKFEAKIVDNVSGEALSPGNKGELWLRSPTIMKGYVADEKATAETLDPEGWLKTGDLCYFDSQGFLYIVDRLKELIKYKAYQVPPAELELLLLSNPEIADAAVIPYPDEYAGQIPMAFVVRKPGSNITAYEVMDFVAKQVAPYKKIRRLSFVNSIPKSASGKILRRELVTPAFSAASSKL